MKNIQILNKNSKLDLAFKALFVILLKILNSKLIFPIFLFLLDTRTNIHLIFS